MKKAVTVIGALMIALSLVAGGFIVYALLNQYGPADMSENINVLMERSDDWERLVDEPVVPQSEMAIIDGSTATLPITLELYRQFYGYSDEELLSMWQHSDIIHTTTPSAISNLIETSPIERDFEQPDPGAAPISLIFVTPPSLAELNHAESLGVELDMTPVAKDGFIFITHKDNPVDSLTMEQVRAIYSGRITNWSELGGEDRPIIAYQREEGSGSQTALEELVMAGESLMTPPDTQEVWGMGMLIEKVAEYTNGRASIGYTFAYYLNNLYQSDDIKVLVIDGASASDQAIAEGSYPLSMSYYAIIRADESPTSPARKLRDFLVGPQGQEVVAMAGYVKAEG